MTELNSVGAAGLFADWGTTPYDEAALNGWKGFIKNFNIGDADPFNGQSVTNAERNAAKRGVVLFSNVVKIKKNAISEFMIANYRGEAKKLSTRFAKNRDEIVENNYQLFLKKYMAKDSDENWKRKEEMWNKDQRGNYTGPKKDSN